MLVVCRYLLLVVDVVVPTGLINLGSLLRKILAAGLHHPFHLGVPNNFSGSSKAQLRPRLPLVLLPRLVSHGDAGGGMRLPAPRILGPNPSELVRTWPKRRLQPQPSRLRLDRARLPPLGPIGRPQVLPALRGFQHPTANRRPVSLASRRRHLQRSNRSLFRQPRRVRRWDGLP